MSLTDLSARQLSAQIEAKHVSCVEVMQATLDRIEATNGGLNAIVSLRERDQLMEQAALADGSERAGWLHGIPMAIKDLTATAGIRTTYGSPLFSEFVPDTDDLLVQRLKADGAIVIGKTNTPEFGLGSNTFNPVHGITPNAYDQGRTCGGSSGGAAVALAARMVSVADGSDMMGSLRNPAAWSNVYGMRPTHGLVPDHPAGEMFLHPLSTLGPMARSPRDLAALLETIAGPHPESPNGRDFSASSVSPGLAGKRIGWLGDWGSAFAYERGITEVSEKALRAFEDLGANVDSIVPEFAAERIFQSWSTLRSWANAGRLQAICGDPKKRKRLKDTAEWEVARGLEFSAIELHNASDVASQWYRAVSKMFETYDALVLPSAQVWPFDKGVEWPTDIAGHKMDTYHRWMGVVVPVSLIGLPAINVPAGFGDNGLPMGVQIFGPRGADAALLGMAESYHQATNWPDRMPPPL